MPGTKLLGSKRGLLHLGEVVLGIAVQHQFADFDQRIVRVRPDLGQVEGIEVIGLGFVLRHDLHAHPPLGEVARSMASNRSRCA